MVGQHTPGPWRAERLDGRYTYQDEFHIESAFGTVASVGQGSKANPRILIANAQLIAAAPVLLEALEALWEGVVNGMGDKKAIISQARAAIATARGES